MPASGLESWVVAIAAACEGVALPNDPVLLEFSMNSEEEEEEDEEVAPAKEPEKNELAKSVDPMVELALAREREEDHRALENLARSW